MPNGITVPIDTRTDGRTSESREGKAIERRQRVLRLLQDRREKQPQPGTQAAYVEFLKRQTPQAEPPILAQPQPIPRSEQVARTFRERGVQGLVQQGLIERPVSPQRGGGVSPLQALVNIGAAQQETAELVGALGTLGVQKLIPGEQEIERRTQEEIAQGAPLDVAALRAWRASNLPSTRIKIKPFIQPGAPSFDIPVGVKGAIELAADPINIALAAGPLARGGAAALRGAGPPLLRALAEETGAVRLPRELASARIRRFLKPALQKEYLAVKKEVEGLGLEFDALAGTRVDEFFLAIEKRGGQVFPPEAFEKAPPQFREWMIRGSGSPIPTHYFGSFDDVRAFLKTGEYKTPSIVSPIRPPGAKIEKLYEAGKPVAPAPRFPERITVTGAPGVNIKGQPVNVEELALARWRQQAQELAPPAVRPRRVRVPKPAVAAVPPARPPAQPPAAVPPGGGILPEPQIEAALAVRGAPPSTERLGLGFDIPGTPTKSLEQADDAVAKFSQFLVSPESQNAWDLTKAMRQEALGQRAARLQARAEELVIEGRNVEDAIQQAMRETMTGQLPGTATTIADDLTDEIRDALFAKVYHVLKDEPFELMSTSEALRNALLNKPIPRTVGVAGGSAYTRLLRVFGDQPGLINALDKPQSLKNLVDDALLTSQPKPIGVDQEIADYLRNLPSRPARQIPGLERAQPEFPGLGVPGALGREPAIGGEFLPTRISEAALGPIERARATELLGVELGKPPIRQPSGEPFISESLRGVPSQPRLGGEFVAPSRLAPETRTSTQKALDLQEFKVDMLKSDPSIPKPVSPRQPPFEPVIEDSLGQMSMVPRKQQNLIVQALKEAGMTAIDIGNFMRANMSSFDFSFWRQQMMLATRHPIRFGQANVEAWKALWSQRAAQGSWDRILRDPLYKYYEELDLDFLRPLVLPKGAPQFKGVEEFGFLHADRPIPKFTGKLPHVKISQRAFVTGTNGHNWRIFKDYFESTWKVNEKIAAGQIKLKPGEAFNIAGEMKAFGRMLEDMTGRAQLGKLSSLSPAMNAGFFSMRLNLGRLLTPRHLISANPRVRKEAWATLSTFVGTIGGVLLLGEQMGLWSVEKDSRSANFGKIRVGGIRIDPWGGFQQFARFFSTMLTKTGVSSTTGAEFDTDPWNTLTRFLRTKAAPFAGLMSDFYTGKTFLGDKVDIKNPKQWLDRVAPFALMDIYDAVNEMGITGLISVVPSILGLSTQTYEYKISVLRGEWADSLVEYDAIPADSNEREVLGIRMSRDQYRKRHPDIDARLFILGDVTSLSRAAVSKAAKIIREEGIDPKEIRGIRERLEGVEERGELGLAPRRDRTEVGALMRILGETTTLQPADTEAAARRERVLETLRQLREPAGVAP